MGANSVGLICPNSSTCIYPSSGIRSPEKQAAQIGHLSAHECEQFRVAHPLTSDGESLSTRKD